MDTTDRIAICAVSQWRQVSGRTFKRTLAIRNARWHMGYGHPQDSVTHHCAGWASGPQNLRQVHWISGSKSSSASDGSCRVVTATKAKVQVETFAVGARGNCANSCRVWGSADGAHRKPDRARGLPVRDRTASAEVPQI